MCLKKRFTTVFLLFSILAILHFCEFGRYILTLYHNKIYKNGEIQNQILEKANIKKSQVKIPFTIMVWNDRYGQDNWGFSREPRKDFIEMGCLETNCVVTDNRSEIMKAYAVMFHIVGGMHERPKIKLKHQRWIFFEHEPPCGAFIGVPWDSHWNSGFNWTQTFRLDSDLPMNYGEYCKRTEPAQIDFNAIMKKKTKPVIWMVSNCGGASSRLDYVRELIKYIPIDVYGGCSSLFNQSNHCNRGKKCLADVANTYKFYLSFENSLAKDYVTEKYFKILTINTVPVVRSDGNYAVIGPPNSVINTKHYPSPKMLAEYLHLLDKNDEEYLKYLKWKVTYKIDRHDPKCWTNEPSWCKLCSKLNNPNEPESHYPDVRKWFGPCRKANDIP